jgi:hypothetical protein
MKIKKSYASIVILLSAIILIINGCRKADRDKDTDTSAASDNSKAENVFAGIFKSIGEFSDSTSQLRIASCATFTVDSVGTTSWPKTLTLDFGTSNCLGADGNYRRGKIIATFTGRYRDSLTMINISLINYYHNDNKVQVGTHTIKNNGHNSAGHLTYTITVQNASITNTSNQTISWNSYRTREWIAGESTTFNPWDDVYLIGGTANGTAANGNTFSVVINSPLRVALDCHWVEQGVLTLTPQNLSARVIDFGNGTCDAAATVTINGTSHDITMQ